MEASMRRFTQRILPEPLLAYTYRKSEHESATCSQFFRLAGRPRSTNCWPASESCGDKIPKRKWWCSPLISGQLSSSLGRSMLRILVKALLCFEVVITEPSWPPNDGFGKRMDLESSYALPPVVRASISSLHVC